MKSAFDAEGDTIPLPQRTVWVRHKRERHQPEAPPPVEPDALAALMSRTLFGMT
jgi:hypothetical protein